jgi:hypothetical protein
VAYGAEGHFLSWVDERCTLGEMFVFLSFLLSCSRDRVQQSEPPRLVKRTRGSWTCRIQTVVTGKDDAAVILA